MTFAELFAVFVAAICYGASSVTHIQLSGGRRTSGAVAFGPALIALGPAGYDLAPAYFVVAAGLTVQALAMVAWRMSLRRFAVVALCLILSAGAFEGAAELLGGGALAQRGPVKILVATIGASLPYVVGGLLLGIRRHRFLSLSVLAKELRWAAAIYAVLLSTLGLVVLAFRTIGWVSFPTLLLVLLFTQHQFRLFAEARTTYEQTVKAMGRLTEQAGYVELGHHEQVASLCVAMADELGFDWEDTRDLELVALVHEVGAVTLPEPRDIESIDSDYVARHGAEILEEAGRLANQARFLWSGTGRAPSLEAQILRAACIHVSRREKSKVAASSPGEPPSFDCDVLDALEACTRQGPGGASHAQFGTAS